MKKYEISQLEKKDISFIPWLFIWSCLLGYTVSEACGCRELLAYSAKSSLLTLFSSVFVHINVLHLVLNLFAFIGVYVSLRRMLSGTAMFLYAFPASWLATWLVVGDTPVMGSSGVIYALLGIDFFRSLRQEKSSKATRFYAISLLISFLFGCLHPAVHGYLHIVAFVCGFSLFGICRYVNRLYLPLFMAVFLFSSCSTTRKYQQEQRQERHEARLESVEQRESSGIGTEQKSREYNFLGEEEIWNYDTISTLTDSCVPVLRQKIIRKWKVQEKDSTTAVRKDSTIVRSQFQQKSKSESMRVYEQEEQWRKSQLFYLSAILFLVLAIIVVIKWNQKK